MGVGGVGVHDRVLRSRVLQSLWELLLRMILDALTENRGVQVEFYNRFQYTVEVRPRLGGTGSAAAWIQTSSFSPPFIPRRSCSSSTPGGRAFPRTT